MSRYLGLDYGLERTGLAISDPAGKMAFPLCTLVLSQCGSRKNLLNNLAKICLAEKIESIVLGLPLYTDGKENEMCTIVRNFAKRLEHRGDWQIFFEPEVLSSEAALEILQATGGKKEKVDQVAACVILQSFLDRQKTF